MNHYRAPCAHAPRRWIAALIVAALATVGCTQQPQQKAEAAPRPVRVMTVTPALSADAIELPAEVRPRFETRYGFRVPGKITSRTVALGQTVAAGQELARLDPKDVLPAIEAQKAQVAAASTEAEITAADLKRTRELRDRNFVSQAQVERAQAAHDAAAARAQAATAQLRQASNALEFSVLRADKRGVVTAIDAEAGQVVSAGQSVVRVAQLGEKEVVVNVPEQDVDRLRRAATLAIRVSALPDKQYTGKLRELSPLADAATRTFLARVTILDADDALQLGMSATLAASTQGAERIVVPLSALRATGEQASVWVVDAATQTVQPVAVKLGSPTGHGVEVVSGLAPGDRVVTAGANLLVAGQKVRPIDAAG